MLDLQRIAVKILTDAPPTLNLDPFLAIFSRWRADAEHPAQWVDLADYAHMPRGPGILLAGKRANFSFDLTDPSPGILYRSKKDLIGTPDERLEAVVRSCFAMAARLAAEPEFPRGVSLRTGHLELEFNDRLETPNDDSTDNLLRPALAAALDRLFGRGSYELARHADPGGRCGFSIRVQNPPPLASLAR